jgi:hypothetical protein
LSVSTVEEKVVDLVIGVEEPALESTGLTMSTVRLAFSIVRSEVAVMTVLAIVDRVRVRTGIRARVETVRVLVSLGDLARRFILRELRDIRRISNGRVMIRDIIKAMMRVGVARVWEPKRVEVRPSVRVLVLGVWGEGSMMLRVSC